MELLDPRVDFVFKRIFGSDANKDVLLAFLNRIFAEVRAVELSEIMLMNPYTDKDDPLDKQSIFDVYAKTADGKLINSKCNSLTSTISRNALYFIGANAMQRSFTKVIDTKH